MIRHGHDQGRLDAVSPVNWDHPLNARLGAWAIHGPRGESLAPSDLVAQSARATPVGYGTAKPWSTPTTRTGAIGPAYLQPGSGSPYLDIGHFSTLLSGSTRFSLAAWVYKPAGSSIVGITQGSGPASSTRVGFEFYSGSLYLLAGNGTDSQSYGTSNAAGWHHVVMTWSASTYPVGYVNGSAFSTPSQINGTATSMAAPGTYTMAAGRNTYSGVYYNDGGAMHDDIRLWPGRVLTAAEVSELYRDSLRGYRDTLRRVRGRSWVAAGGASYTADATIAGVGALSATGVREQFSAATISGAGSLSATANREAIVSATVAGTTSLSATAVYEAIASATIAGAGTISATAAGVNTYTASASIAGVGGLSATAIRETFGAATLAGTGSVDAAAVRTAVASATIAGSATITITTLAAAADLVEAVADWLDSDASLVAQFGRAGFLSAGAAGRATPLPHVVWTDVSGSILGDAAPAGDGSDLAWVDRHSYQIAVYAGTRREARSLARGVARSLERAAEAGSIRFDEGTLLYLRRDGDGIDQLDPDRGPAGKDVWSHVIQFLAMIESSDA